MDSLDDYNKINERRRTLGQQPIRPPMPLVASLNGGRVWREWQHPRDRIGRWIEKMGRVKIFGKGKSLAEAAGYVNRINRDGTVSVKLDSGETRTVSADQLEGSQAKAILPQKAADLPAPVRVKAPRRPYSPTHPGFSGEAATLTDGKSWSDIRDALADKDIVFFDFETTGLDVDTTDRPVEVAAVKVRNGKVIDRTTTLVNPGQPVPEFTRNLTGITDADVADAPDSREAVQRLRDFMGDSIVSAYNAEFDLTQMNTVLKEMGLERPVGGVIDPMTLARHIIAPKKAGGPVDGHKLAQLAAYFNIPLGDKAHRADADTEATALVFDALLGYAIDNNVKPYPRERHQELYEKDKVAWPAKIDAWRSEFADWKFADDRTWPLPS